MRHDAAMPLARSEGVLTTPEGRRVGWLRLGDPALPSVGYWHGQPGSRRDVLAFEDTIERYGLSVFSVDRAGYGETDPLGLDRREVARDLLMVADHLRVGSFAVMGVSMGAVYALATAALAPERVTRVLMVAGHALPYGDEEVVAALSDSEQADVAMLRDGRTPELERAYADGAAAVVADPLGLLHRLAEHWHPREQALVSRPWAGLVADSLAFGLAPGSEGYLQDGLRTVRPLEFDPADVRCPVRAVHGSIDDLEPLANLERLAAQLSDVQLVVLPGLGHFGPWLWPDLFGALLTGA